jgi:predicted  nucleic acid-binding Zn-ribbon protein
VSYQRPDIPALAELEELVRHANEEASSWRSRSLKAEGELARLKDESGALGGPELIESRQRQITLETENRDLRQRVEGARHKIAILVERMAFLERETIDEAS